MKFSLLLITVFISAVTSYAQVRTVAGKKQKDSTYTDLKEVVVTGEYQPQSIKNSVYRTRVITGERIRLRAATNIQQVLNTELGFRFSNDLTTGTSDVQMMGVKGRDIKILLDGVPLIDRSDTRESLNQVDINTIERIEIIDGPLAVSYGTDALAGVINIITKRPAKNAANINARVQEETAGNEYSPFTKKGSHQQHIGGSWGDKNWYVLAGLTHTEFNGFNVPGPLATQDEINTIVNRMKPKEQWLSNTKVGYSKDNFNAWYRLDYVNETIDSKGAYNPNNYTSTNQKYITNRYTQQLQADYKVNDRLQFNGSIGYGNLARRTRTVKHNYTNGTDSLTTGEGEQDVAKFQSTSIRTTAQYKLTDEVAFQPGIEVNLDHASGARVSGDPSIQDYAFFISSELKLIKGVMIRPGLRFIHNSVYAAPPVIPSLNTKIILTDHFDLRMSYASGFRAPALRELYYDFIDASHKILGNKDLKAEKSNSFNASVTYTAGDAESVHFSSALSGFYNNYTNRIAFGLSATDPTVTTLINIESFKTLGGSLENTLLWKHFQASLGLIWVGSYNVYSKTAKQYGESSEFVWSPEINSNLTYTFPKAGATVNLAFKYTGKQPNYELYTDPQTNVQHVRLAEIGSYTIADLMFTKRIAKSLMLNAGINNLANITNLSNSSLVSTDPHGGGGGPVPLNYGRSYVIGLSYNWDKK